MPFAFLISEFALLTFISVMLEPQVKLATSLFFETWDKTGYLGALGSLLAVVIFMLWILLIATIFFSLFFATALTKKMLK